MKPIHNCWGFCGGVACCCLFCLFSTRLSLNSLNVIVEACSTCFFPSSSTVSCCVSKSTDDILTTLSETSASRVGAVGRMRGSRPSSCSGSRTACDIGAKAGRGHCLLSQLPCFASTESECSTSTAGTYWRGPCIHRCQNIGERVPTTPDGVNLGNSYGDYGWQRFVPCTRFWKSCRN